jgi:hypothetical protein
MSFKKAIKKIAAVATGVALVGTTLAGALAYDLSDYPAPFVEDGVFDGLIVVGANAKPIDTLGSIDIAAALQAASVTTVDMEGSSSGSTLSGDVAKVEGGSNMLELGEDPESVLGSFDDGDLDALASGVLSTSEETTTYDQYLDLLPGNVVTFQESDSELNDKVVGDFWYVAGGNGIFSYEIQFNDGFESETEITSTGATTYLLPDLEDEVMYMFGNTYSVARAEIDTVNDPAFAIEMELLRGDFSDTLQEGETQVYELNGVEYEVTVLAIDDSNGKVMFLINGDVSDLLSDGDTDRLDNGVEVGVRNVIVNEAEETTGGDLVEFYLGSEKITLADDDTSSTADPKDGYVDISDNTYDKGDGFNLQISASEPSSSKFSVDSIEFIVSTEGNEDLWVGPGQTLREAFVAEDDEKADILFFENLDFLYEGLTEEQTSTFEIRSSGKDKYNLEFTNTDGDEYSVQFIENEGTIAVLGDGDDRLLFPTSDNVTLFSGAEMDEGDMFILSDENVTNVKDDTVTRIIQLDNIDDGNEKVEFKDLAGGTYTGNYDATGVGDVKIGSESYDFKMNLTTNASIEYFDFNGDGDYETIIDSATDSGTYTTAPITVRGGLYADFTFTNAGPFVTDANGKLRVDDATMAVTEALAAVTLSYAYDTSIVDTASLVAGKTFVMNIAVDGTDLDELDSSLGAQTLPLGGTLYEPEDQNDYEVGMDSFGTLYEYEGDTDEPSDLTVTVPRDQREAQLFVVASETTVRKKSVGGSYEIVNPLPPGFSVLDNEVDLGDANMIVVGGPCVNTIAAAMLDNPEVCTEGFEMGKARIELYNVEGTYALLVAGYGAQDTRGAAYVLSDYETYDLMGEKVEVVVTSLDDIDVSTVE